MTSDRHFLEERYRGEDRRAGLRRAYYRAKPLLPRRAQLALRRAYAPVQARAAFPAWPVEDVLVRRELDRRRAVLDAAGGAPVAVVPTWPQRARFAVALTHDVEGPAGVDNVLRVIDLERRHGFVSSWNFVAEWYPIPDGLFDAVRASGCEVGLHGIRHDGRLFESRERFEAELPRIVHYAQAWGVEGFRSPATHRNADWMAELPVAYDSSFPDTDPFEPQAGGCCSILPFRFGDVVELPITLPQDHTLWEVLQDRSIERWVQKASWVAQHGGLVTLIVHPDYVVDEDRLGLYEQFLVWLRAQDGAWHALPRDIARWWREREGLEVRDGRLHGETSFEASVAWLREREGEVVLDA